MNFKISKLTPLQTNMYKFCIENCGFICDHDPKDDEFWFLDIGFDQYFQNLKTTKDCEDLYTFIMSYHFQSNNKPETLQEAIKFVDNYKNNIKTIKQWN